MKNLFALSLSLSLSLSICFTAIMVSSCSSSDDIESVPSVSKKVTLEQSKQSGQSGPVVQTTPANSYKLIFENATTVPLTVFNIFAKGINTTPNYTNFINFKGSSTSSFNVTNAQIVSFTDFVTATPASYAIPQWRIQYSTTNQNQDFLATAIATLNGYGIQIPSAPVGNKYSYWTGVDVAIAGYTSSGNVSGTGATRLGRIAFDPNSDTQIVFAKPLFPNISVTWTLLSNGDVKIKAQ